MAKFRYNFNGLDLFKFIAAILILVLHANPFGSTTAGVIVREIITPIAVPFFFATSGFLFYISIQSGGLAKGKSKILKTLKLYLIWSAIYFPFVVASWVINDSFNLQSILNYPKLLIFEGSFQTIWFLNALWLASFIVFLLLKRLTSTRIFLVSLPFYILSCLLSTWNGLLVVLPGGEALSDLYYSFFETTKNGLLFGFTYVALGVMVAEWYLSNRNCNESAKNKSIFDIKKAIAVIGASFGAIIVEYMVRTRWFEGSKSCDITFALLPVTIGLLVLSLTLDFKDSPKYKTLRVYSTLVFLTQRIFLTGFSWADILVEKIIGRYIFTNVPVVYFLLITASTFVFSWCIIKLTKKFKWLSYIY